MITSMRAFSVLLINIFMSSLALDGCSTDDDCIHFQGLASWNDEYVTSLCVDDGVTDKSTNAVLCDDYVGNPDYENSLKLAILNTMYGTGTSACKNWCMYDPLSVTGLDSIAFKWNNQQACWNVIIGRTSPTCHEQAVAEWSWAADKSANWCCPAGPTIEPTDSPCSTGGDCYPFQDLASWNQEYVSSLCINDGNTDKSMSATLCEADVGNLDYENSLKLAILNKMYGSEAMPSASSCPQWCMYDPLNIIGDAAVGFKWMNNQGCWKVVVGATNNLCYTISQYEWEWAILKAENWCCPSDPIPTIMPTTVPTKNPIPCSADDNCYQFQSFLSWNQEYVSSLCNNHGKTDKSWNATLCEPYVDDVAYNYGLILAIINTMYGTGSSASHCPQWCMYDPLHTSGQNAVGFKWNNKMGCWNVLLGATNYLCYVSSQEEWSWAVAKTNNWCCPL